MIPRALVFGITIAILIAWYFEPAPKPYVQVVTPYCRVDVHAAAVDPDDNEWHSFWTEGYGLCSQQDRYVDS